MRRFFQSLALLVLVTPLVAEKRPLTQDDFDGWRHIQNQTLSNDGHYLAYGLFPQQGDGELVVRDLKTGREMREPIGELPPPPPPDYSAPQREEAPPAPPGVALKFTPDSRFVVCSAFPARAAVEQAKRERRKPEDMPKGDVVIIQLANRSVFRDKGARDFQLPSEAGDFVAYLDVPDKPSSVDTQPRQQPNDNTHRPAIQPVPRPRKLEAGDLVLRNLAAGTERRFTQASEYLFTKDGKTLVYAVSGDGETNGVFAVTPGSSAAPVALVSGVGAYNKLAWDEDQTRLAFLSNHDERAAAATRGNAQPKPGSKRPDYNLYTWDRQSAEAEEAVSSATRDFPAGWAVSNRASVMISKGGERIFFGIAPQRHFRAFDRNVPDDERVSVDLWSWKDDFIQPMQKIRAASEEYRSYRAVYEVAQRRFVQLSDQTMNDVLPSDDGRYAIGSDDRAYRRMEDYDGNYTDSYVVDTATGQRRLIVKKHVNRLTWSPTSKYAIYFNGKDWISVSTTDTRSINLTGKLPVSFANEQNDTPGFADSYRLAGWTRDGQSVLLYDRYDIWRCAADGSSAVDITQGAGRRNHLQFRIVRLEAEDPASRWIDPAKPLLLRAENDQTRGTGFFATTLKAETEPKRLIFASKNFAPPIKARDADVYLTAASTFNEYPNLLVSDASFRELRRVTDADPQMAGLLWGSAELVHYNNLDGVPLESILYKPADFDPTKKYPLVVYIYERLTQNVNNFIEPRPYNSISPSYYASNGYLVLEPDIAYRVGYPGQSALNCVLPAVQAVVNQGFVNESAIGIQGHSWGGYQIAYMITRTNRFKAAAAGAPVADMISAYDSIRWGPGIPRQFQYERTQSRIGGSVWEYPLRYIENSPIFSADRVKTPLLMIHNDADDAVPWYQGIEYYLALRRLNKEVYLFSYNGEPHNLRRRVNQKDYFLRLQQYFDYYLKNAPEPEWMMHGIPYLEKPGVALSADEP